MLGLDNKGKNVFNYKLGKLYKDAIEQDLHLPGTSKGDFGKVFNLKPEFIVVFRIMLAAIFTRNEGTYTISWPHKHFIFFMLKKVKINLAACLFEHLCTCITEGHHKSKSVIHHPRLISERLRQTKLIEVLRRGTPEKLRVFSPFKFKAQNLLNMKLIKGPVIYSPDPLLEKFEEYFFSDGYPTMLEANNEEVIKNFLAIFKDDTGIEVDRSMVAALPDWDRFNNPKRKEFKKTKNVESILIEDEVAKQGGDDSEKRGAVGSEKEMRSKKRNERLSSDDEDNAPYLQDY
jgi:hypothetical protein